MDLEAIGKEVAQWCVGAELRLGMDLRVEYFVLQGMPSRTTLRKDWYQKWKELPRVEHDYPSAIDDVCQPVDYGAEVYDYPGFDQKREQVIGNSAWFYQEIVQERNECMQAVDEDPWYTDLSEATTEVDILIPVKFAVLNCDKALRRAVVRYKGQPVLEMSVKEWQLPRVLLVINDQERIEVEVCGYSRELEERGFWLDVGECVDRVTMEEYRR